MLGCYIGPVGVAARGVPARFLGGAEAQEEAKEGEQSDKDGGNDAATNKTESEPKAPSGDASTTSTSSPSAAAVPTPAAATAGDPMEIDT